MNFFAIFVMVGYFIFVFQYLQLVLGLSPLEAGAWGLPGAIAFVLTSQITPRVVGKVGVKPLVTGGLAVTVVGLALLLGVRADGGLGVVVAGSVIISLGLGPVFGLTTELIVGSAPPEKAGAASGISETAAELGGALGIAAFGSIGVAIYRDKLDTLPAGVTPEAAAAARDTLGGAVSAAADLPTDTALALLNLANEAFVTGMRVSTGIGVVVTAALVGLAAVGLHTPKQSASEQA